MQTPKIEIRTDCLATGIKKTKRPYFGMCKFSISYQTFYMPQTEV